MSNNPYKNYKIIFLLPLLFKIISKQIQEVDFIGFRYHVVLSPKTGLSVRRVLSVEAEGHVFRLLPVYPDSMVTALSSFRSLNKA